MADAGKNDAHPSAVTTARWWQPGGNFAWALSLFLAGLGAKLGLILSYGLAFPYWDQWPGEAEEMIWPYLAGRPLLKVLFTPHNEHRIVFTRALDLDGLLAAADDPVDKAPRVGEGPKDLG